MNMNEYINVYEPSEVFHYLNENLVSEIGRLRKYILERKKIDKSELESALDDYLKYISLRVCFPLERLTPSWNMDIIWHSHLMLTPEYLSMNEKISSQYIGTNFIHHRPTLKGDNVSNRNDYKKMCLLYDKFFERKADRKKWKHS